MEEKKEDTKETESPASEGANEIPETTEVIPSGELPPIPKEGKISPLEEVKDKFWIPKTSLGRQVLEGKIKSIEEILLAGKKIVEPEIVDHLIFFSYIIPHYHCILFWSRTFRIVIKNGVPSSG